MEIIDLHTHTTASDGSLNPAELVEKAREAGLRALAITDHDTTDGLDRALEAGRRLGLEVVPGVEISCDGGFAGGMHLVGLFIDHHHPELLAGLKRLQRARAERNPKIVANFQRLGIDLSLEEVAALAGGEIISRAHFAQALVQRGLVGNRAEAFNRYLAAGKPAYAPKFRYPPDQAIALIRRAGGVPVLAHPGLLPLAKPQLEPLLAGLKEHGLEGVEALYSEHDTALRRHLTSLAARLELVISGGSDFHGRPKPDVRLGTGLGDLRVPATLLTALRQRAQKIRREKQI